MRAIRNNKALWLTLLMWLCLLTPAKADEGEVNVQEIVFSHIQDAYTWHITEWGDTEVAIPLPIIVRSEAAETKRFSACVKQEIFSGDSLLASLDVKFAFINSQTMRPELIPDRFLAALKGESV